VRSSRVRNSAAVHTIIAGLLCCFLTSCIQGDDGPPLVEAPPPASLSDLFGNTLFDADGNPVGIEAIEKKAIIGIYFSAQWCPACATFTPLLLSAYQELQEAQKSFEVVLVSYDHSSADMFAHMTHYAMPWLAVPHGGDKAVALAERYDVRLIPTLIIIDREGNTISMNGRGDLAVKGAAAYDDWLAASTGQ